MGWSAKIDLVYRVIVCIQNSLNPIAFGMENVAVEGEAMGSVVVRGGINSAAEAVDWVHLIMIVVFQNIHDRLDGLCVSISLVIT